MLRPPQLNNSMHACNLRAAVESGASGRIHAFSSLRNSHGQKEVHSTASNNPPRGPRINVGDLLCPPPSSCSGNRLFTMHHDTHLNDTAPFTQLGYDRSSILSRVHACIPSTQYFASVGLSNLFPSWHTTSKGLGKASNYNQQNRGIKAT